MKCTYIFLMVLAVFLIVSDVVSLIIKFTKAIVYKRNDTVWAEIVWITIGLSYLIWFCN